MPTPSIQTLRNDAQQVLNLDSISAVRSVVAATLANANAGTPLNPNLTTQQLWNQFYQIVTQPKSDIESIIANQLMKFVFAPPAPGGAGANHEVIYNNNGVLAGDTKFLWDDGLNKLDIDGSAIISTDLIVRTTGFVVNSAGVGIGTATPNTNLNRGTLTLQGAWGGQVDINVGATNHAQFGSDNFSSGASCRIQSLDHIAFKTNNGTILGAYLNANGVFSLQNAVSNANGIGIAFPATQAASSNANTLDDYEEGTWTPTVAAETGTIGTTVVNSANYTKVGRLVSVTFDITITSAGTGTAGLKVSLPFSPSVAGNTCGALREYQVTGNMGQVYKYDATNALCNLYNNSTLIVANYRIMAGYTYFV